jgi:hypothetical protein
MLVVCVVFSETSGSVIQGRKSNMNGKNRHELLITPKPDKKPKIIVSRTMSLDIAIVVVSDEAKATGRGICENAKR